MIIKQIINFIVLAFFMNVLIPKTFCQLKEELVSVKIILIDESELTGFISETDEKNISTGVNFKELKTSLKATKYSVDKIKRLILVGGEIYENQKVKVGNETIYSQVLAQKLVEGLANLYQFQLFGKEYFNLIMPDSTYLLQNDEIRSGLPVKYYFRIGLKNALNVENEEVESTKIRFSKPDFIKLASNFNLKNSKINKVISPKLKESNFIIGYLGGTKKGNQNELFGQLIYRKYFPKIDRNTSLNFSALLFNTSRLSNYGNYKYRYFAIPASIQYNFNSKKIRPYLFGGTSLAYVFYFKNEDSKIDPPQLRLTLNGGIGVEMNLSDQLLLRSEARYEFNIHLISFGIGYIFRKSDSLSEK